MIPYGRQSVDESDVEAVVAVLRSDWLTQGPAVGRFEAAVAGYCGDGYACAANSATSALHMACLALGLKPGGRLWTVPNTFVASANCGRYCGAEVDFVDIEPETWCIDPAALERKLQRAEADGVLPDIVVAVDFAGQPCDYDALGRLKARYGFALLQDASHAIGAEYNGSKVGFLPQVDATVFSFHPVKIVTSGEGGMLLTTRPEIDARARMIRSHGIVREKALLENATQGDWYYEQQALGFNYRMTDLQAALGCSQMARLASFLEKRQRLAARYDELLAGLPVCRQTQASGRRSAWHLYPVLLVDEPTRRQVFDAMRSAGIGVQVHYLPVHLQPYYRQLGFAPGICPVAEAHGRRALSLPLYPALCDDDQARVVAALKEALA